MKWLLPCLMLIAAPGCGADGASLGDPSAGTETVAKTATDVPFEAEAPGPVTTELRDVQYRMSAREMRARIDLLVDRLRRITPPDHR